jgi:hypothetical protein
MPYYTWAMGIRGYSILYPGYVLDASHFLLTDIANSNRIFCTCQALFSTFEKYIFSSEISTI